MPTMLYCTTCGPHFPRVYLELHCVVLLCCTLLLIINLINQSIIACVCGRASVVVNCATRSGAMLYSVEIKIGRQ